jgi:hypothetical protein
MAKGAQIEGFHQQTEWDPVVGFFLFAKNPYNNHYEIIITAKHIDLPYDLKPASPC